MLLTTTRLRCRLLAPCLHSEPLSSELHIFVRPEIRSLEDLRGKKVNFNTQGTAAAYSGPLIFSRLGLNVEKMFIPHQVALEQMKCGEVSAVVFVTSKPVDAFLKGDAGIRASRFSTLNTTPNSRTIIFHHHRRDGLSELGAEG